MGSFPISQDIEERKDALCSVLEQYGYTITDISLSEATSYDLKHNNPTIPKFVVNSEEFYVMDEYDCEWFLCYEFVNGYLPLVDSDDDIDDLMRLLRTNKKKGFEKIPHLKVLLQDIRQGLSFDTGVWPDVIRKEMGIYDGSRYLREIQKRYSWNNVIVILKLLIERGKYIEFITSRIYVTEQIVDLAKESDFYIIRELSQGGVFSG